MQCRSVTPPLAIEVFVQRPPRPPDVFMRSRSGEMNELCNLDPFATTNALLSPGEVEPEMIDLENQ
jgi:hypothetical protein